MNAGHLLVIGKPFSEFLRIGSKVGAGHYVIVGWHGWHGAALLLGTTLDLPENVANRINLFIEADFVTYESDGFFVIARYRDGQIHLVHEKSKGR
jgi:hypothetical protein